MLTIHLRLDLPHLKYSIPIVTNSEFPHEVGTARKSNGVLEEIFVADCEDRCDRCGVPWSAEGAWD